MDWSEVERRVRDVAREGTAAWPALAIALDAVIPRLARNQPIGRLRADVDAPREITTSVLERMHANDFRAIRRYAEASPAPPIDAWLRVIVRTTAIDVMRRHTEYVRAAADRGAGWLSLVSLAPSKHDHVPDTLAAKRREVESFLEDALAAAREVHEREGADGFSQLAVAWKVAPLHVRRLVNKGASYLPVLRLVFEGWSYPEVATRLEMSRREVELVVEYIEELLAARGFAASP